MAASQKARACACPPPNPPPHRQDPRTYVDLGELLGDHVQCHALEVTHAHELPQLRADVDRGVHVGTRRCAASSRRLREQLQPRQLQGLTPTPSKHRPLARKRGKEEDQGKLPREPRARVRVARAEEVLPESRTLAVPAGLTQGLRKTLHFDTMSPRRFSSQSLSLILGNQTVMGFARLAGHRNTRNRPIDRLYYGRMILEWTEPFLVAQIGESHLQTPAKQHV